MNDSQFYRALHISYPNPIDKKQAREKGVSPGGDIEIHGLSNSWKWIGPLHRWINWTEGCIALTNKEIDENITITVLIMFFIVFSFCY